MYAIRENVKSVNGKQFDTFSRDVIEPGTVLLVQAGTTGYRGSNARNDGCRAFLSIECLIGDFHFRLIRDEDGTVTGAEIACCGDASLDAVIKALNFIQQAIWDQMDGIDD